MVRAQLEPLPASRATIESLPVLDNK